MALAGAWLAGKRGSMAPIEQAKLWALRVVLRKQGEEEDQFAWMSTQVKVVGGGHPTREAVRRFFQRVDQDEAWHPGKRGDVGRPQALTPHKRRVIAESAMALKKRRMEPSYTTVVAQCPRATRNPQTGAAFSRGTINSVLTTDCYDHDPGKPWRFRFASKRKPLTQTMQADRRQWACRLRKEVRAGKGAAWFARNVVWIDVCSKVIPGTPQKAFEQSLAGRSKRRRLISADARCDSLNLGGAATAEKQCSQGDTRVFFFVALTRGVLGVSVFTDVADVRVENGRCVAKCVERLPGMLERMLGVSAPKPRVLFSDRGPGFFHRRLGSITSDYDAACRRFGFTPWAGTDCTAGPRRQPSDIADVLLHETAISWLRHRLALSARKLTKPWTETPSMFAKRLQADVREVNDTCGVAKLCYEFPTRLHALVARRGDRLSR